MYGLGQGGQSASSPDQAYEDASRLSELLTEARAVVTSEDHTVTVTVVPGNVVSAIELAQQARRHNGEQLGDLILQTIKAASAQLKEELTASAAELGPMAQNAVATLGGELPDAQEATGLGPPEPPELNQLDQLGLDELDLDALAQPSAEELEFMRRHGVEEQLMEATTRLDNMIRVAEEMIATYEQTREQMSQATASARSSDGGIEVEVKSGVGVTRISIDDRVLRHGPGRVGPMVMSAIQQANAQLALNLAGPAQSYVGSRMNIEGMVESYLPEGFEPEDDNQRGGRSS